MNQKVAIRILQKLGYHADVVADGREALKALDMIPYDLVLMDCQMPEMDGYETTRRIRQAESVRAEGGNLKPEKTERTKGAAGTSRSDTQPSAFIPHPSPRLPIIAMTANAMKGDREKCLKAGMDDYVSKPVAPEALAEVLEKWLVVKPVPISDIRHPISESPVPISDIRHPISESPVPISDIRYPISAFNRAVLLDRMMDDADLVREVLDEFLADIPRQIETLKDGIAAGDIHTAERQAHSIKGAAANVAAEALREAAFEMEKAGKAGDMVALKAGLPAMEKEFGRLRKAMERQE